MSELVSVIVPIYNAEKYLDRCINSIINQTYSNLEILLVDDGSQDCCPEICMHWAENDSRIKILHQDNKGVSAARNTGILYSTGQYIVMVDSDDYLASEMIHTLYTALIQNQADLAICSYETGTDNCWQFKKHKCTDVEILSGQKALAGIYLDNYKALQYVAPWAKLYKRELFEGTNYPEGKIFEDIYVTHKILYKCNRVVITSEKLVYYYEHEDSIMHAPFHIGKLDYLEALNERIAFFKEHQLNDLESIAYDEYLHALIWEYSRARDILGNREAMKDIKSRFRTAYRKGYASSRYPNETARFLAVFNFNPELIVAYWKLDGKRKSLFNRG